MVAEWSGCPRRALLGVGVIEARSGAGQAGMAHCGGGPGLGPDVSLEWRRGGGHWPERPGRQLAFLVCLALALGGFGCRRSQPEVGQAPASSASGLPPELAQRVLARIGDRNLTVLDYVTALERMDRFERLRYQTKERQKKLLEELVQAELLAQEARRRKLDQTPRTQQRIRQILRDQLLREVREASPAPEAIPESEVREYYRKHQDELLNPERRRVAHLAVESRAAAVALLEQARAATPQRWGQLVTEHSVDQTTKAGPLELRGDLGLVTAPGVERGANEAVREPLRQAVFTLDEIGDVYDGLVEDPETGRYHLVRLIGRTPAGRRSFAEAERAIRVTLAQERLRQAERKLEAELRQKYPVRIDSEALARVKSLPTPPSASPPPAASP